MTYAYDKNNRMTRQAETTSNSLMDLKAKIKQKAQETGIDLIGFSRAKPLDQARQQLERRAGEGRQTSLEHSDIEQRVNPELILPGAKTIITAGLAYGQKDPKSSEGLQGSISRSAWGKDYHRVLSGKLEELARFIVEKSSASKVKCFVDTGPPVDRALAVEAGLGWSGKNCALVNPEFGSWIFLGQIYTDLDLEPDSAIEQGCGECEMCLRACPTGALVEAYVINPFHCVSYLTQMKGFIPQEFRRLLGTKIYGCDTCQNVCPANKHAKLSRTPEFNPDPDRAKPDLIGLSQLSNHGFKEMFGESAAGWRGRTVLQRNALIALGNLKQLEGVKPVTECLGDQRAVIRGHAAWALAEIGDPSALPHLEEALKLERDKQAAEEIALAITRLKGTDRDNG